MKQRLLNPQAARRVIAGLLLLFMALQVAQGQGAVDNWSELAANEIKNENGGDGVTTPILIKTAEELAYLAKTVNEKGNLKVKDLSEINGASGFFGYYFALSDNIDLKGINWTPIGIHNLFSDFKGRFEGHFDGKGYCVSGLSVGYGGDQYTYAGLFGFVQSGSIQNLGVRLQKDKGVRGPVYAGGIVGYLNVGILRNCYVEGPGTVEAIAAADYTYAGGIAGNIDGSKASLSHCYATVDVIARDGASNNFAGGIVGYGNGTISYTYATGSVTALRANDMAGGICGVVNQNTTLSNNLALNKEIKGDGEYIHRVAGFLNDKTSTLASNYASPETYVNGKPVSSKVADDLDGSNENIDLTNYAATLKGAAPAPDGVNEWNSGAWVFDPNGLLPQLQMVTGDDGNGNLTYSDWTNSRQPDLQAANYLIATEIVNEGGDAESGNSWDNPIYIANRAELAYFAKQVNAGGLELKLKNGTDINTNGKIGFPGYYFALSNDIDLAQYHWTPIGTRMDHFCGHFDGKGHCIEGLTVGSENNKYDYAGLFGNVVNGTIQNLGVRLAKNGEIWGSRYAGGIVGYIDISDKNTSAIRNCYVEGPGKVISTGDNNNAGGIAGYTGRSNTTLSHCYATVDVEASGGNENNVGGIVGYGSGNISYTYATGSIQASGKGVNRVGGICGYVYSNTTLSNNLALNKEIKGGDSRTHRVAGVIFTTSTLANNYASLQIPVNSASVYNQDLTSLDGSDAIHIDDYEKALKTEVDEDKQPWVFGGKSYLPKLKMLISNDPDNPEYVAWPNEKQPTLSPDNYLPAKFTLHIVAPTGGSMTVKDGADNEILDNAVVIAGTPLTLSQSANDNYEFVGFLSGTDQDNLSNCDATLTMPKSELWVSAQFKEKPKPEPEPVPVYHTVTLPAVEGATTSPGPGDHEVESWDNFRFYLALDPAYSESQPIVTTSRGETIQPRISDGAYLVKYVRTDVQIFIDGIQPNNPTANGKIDAAVDIKAQGNTLLISVPQAIQASLCDLSGRLLQRLDLAPGQTRIEGLRAGIYIVKVPGYEGVKVIIK